MLTHEPSATPEQVMGTSLRLEIEAAALYQRFQSATTDPELVELWQTMARAETHHARLIADLASVREFPVPVVPIRVLTAIVDRAEAIRREADEGPLTTERMLSITAALEFSEMDDLFTAICRSAGVSPDGGRADHLEPLIQAVLVRQSGDTILRHLLAALIRLERRADVTATPAPPPAMAVSSR
jgi:hypothetical protein